MPIQNRWVRMECSSHRSPLRYVVTIVTTQQCKNKYEVTFGWGWWWVAVYLFLLLCRHPTTLRMVTGEEDIVTRTWPTRKLLSTQLNIRPSSPLFRISALYSTLMSDEWSKGSSQIFWEAYDPTFPSSRLPSKQINHLKPFSLVKKPCSFFTQLKITLASWLS